jgi:hypothetical protein
MLRCALDMTPNGDITTENVPSNFIHVILNDRLCENSETFKTVGIGNHIHDEINDLIPKSVSFMLQSGRTGASFWSVAYFSHSLTK